MKNRNGILSLVAAACVCAWAGCATSSPEKDLVKDNFDFADGQLSLLMDETQKAIAADSPEKAAKEAARGRRPLVSPRSIEPDGSLITVSSRDWTSGFFPGELWYMYEYTQDPKWEAAARAYTAPIEREKDNAITHDMGFKVYCSFGNGYRLTGDPAYKDIILESARTLITRYKPVAKIIRSWDHNRDKWQSPVIIDNMMNLELLFWAFRQTADSTFYDIAVNHARTTLKNHFREDFSAYHVVDYDTLSGNVIVKNTHQGFSHESAWARGQGWAVYGYTMCYRETGLPEFLEHAKSTAKYYFDHPNLPEDLIPYWDFNAPNIPDEPRDVSAAAVVASALYELSMYDTDHAELHKSRADRMVESMTAYRAQPGTEHGFLLRHATGSFPHGSEIDVPLVYADYYFLEALLRKQKLENTGSALL